MPESPRGLKNGQMNQYGNLAPLLGRPQPVAVTENGLDKPSNCNYIGYRQITGFEFLIPYVDQ
jgi:hypothetical protein